MSHLMRTVPESAAELTKTPAKAFRVIATGAAVEGRTTVLIDSDDPNAAGAVTWSVSEAAERVLTSVCGRSPRPEKWINPQDEEKREFHKTTPPTDSIAPTDEGGGDSSDGPQVVFADGKFGMLIDAHAATDPTRVDKLVDRRPRAHVYSPGEAHGGDRENDRVGEIEPAPLRFDPLGSAKPNAVECARVVYRDEVARAIDPHKPVVVRALLWAGMSVLRRDQYTKDKFKKLNSWPADFGKDTIDAQKVYEKLQVHFPGVPELGTYIQRTNPLPRAVGSDEAAHGRITVEARVWGDHKLFVWVYVTLGTVVGPADVDEKLIGKTVYQNGQRSGLTAGKLLAAQAHVDRLAYRRDLTATFDDWFLVRGTGPKSPFSRPGDSNASVYLADEKDPSRLYTLGMVAAGLAVQQTPPPGQEAVNEIITLVQPSAAVLKAHGATLRVATPKK